MQPDRRPDGKAREEEEQDAENPHEEREKSELMNIIAETHGTRTANWDGGALEHGKETLL